MAPAYLRMNARNVSSKNVGYRRDVKAKMEHTEVKKVLAVITIEEAAEIRKLSDKLDALEGSVINMFNPMFDPMADKECIEANNAIVAWFDSMAEKYGFSKEIQCHVNFGPKTICEGLSQSTDPHPDGPLSSPEITEMHKNGTLCEQCGCHMGKPTGYLRLCEDCGGDQG